MSTDNPCERHLFGADGQCVGCGKSGPPKTTTMSMTPERLARWRGFAAESPDNEFADVVDAVEALQAELAEERSQQWRVWEVEFRQAAERRTVEAEDIANLAMRVGSEMYSDAQYWRERHCRESALNAEQSQKNWQRAETAERERDEARAEVSREIARFHDAIMQNVGLGKDRDAIRAERDDLRARLAACVAAFEEFVDDSKWGDRADFSAAMQAIAAAKGGA